MKTILAVEDSKMLRGFVAFTLRQAGYDVKEAAGGQEALRLMKEQQVDCVLTGLSMPDGDGLSLIKELREQGATKTLPILMIASEKEELQRLEGRQAGATGWLTMPFNTDKLLGTIQRVLN